MPVDEIIDDIPVHPDSTEEQLHIAEPVSERLPKSVEWYNSNIDLFNADTKSKLPKVTTEDEISDEDYTNVAKYKEQRVVEDYNKTNAELKLGLPPVTSIAEIKPEDNETLDKAKVIRHITKVNNDLKMAKDVLGKSYKKLAEFAPFKSLEDIKNRGDEYDKILKEATATNTRNERAAVYNGVTEYIDKINKENGLNLPRPKNFEAARDMITPTKDGKIPLDIQINVLLGDKQPNIADTIKSELLQQRGSDIPEARVNTEVKSRVEYLMDQEASAKKRKEDIARLSRLAPKSSGHQGENFLSVVDVQYLEKDETFNTKEEADKRAAEIVAANPEIKGVGVKTLPDGKFEVNIPQFEGDAKYYENAAQITATEALKKQDKANELMKVYTPLKDEIKKLTEAGLPIPPETLQEFNDVSDDIQNYLDAARVLSKTAETNYRKFDNLEGERGGFWKGVAMEGLKSSFSFNKAIANTFLSIAPYISDDISQEDADEAIKKVNEFVRGAEKFYADAIGVTPQYMERANPLQKAVYGVEGIVPYMMAGEAAFPAMVLTGFQANKEALEDNKDLSGDEKNLVSLVKGTVGALVMHYGLKAGQTGTIINRATAKTLNDLPKVFTSKSLTDIAGKNVTQFISQATSGGTGFGTLNAAAVGADAITNDIVNAVKGKEIFTPVHDIIGDALKEFKHGIATGGLLGSITSLVKLGSGKIDNEQQFREIDEILDPRKLPMVELKLREQLIDKTITQAQYKDAVSNIKRVADITSQIPRGFSPASRFEVFKLLQENAELETQKRGLAPVLAKRFDTEIEKNNARINQVADSEGMVGESEPRKEGSPEQGENKKPEKKEVEGTAYHGVSSTEGNSKGIYLAEKGLADDYGDGITEEYRYTLKNPLVISKDGDFDIVSRIIKDYLGKNPGANFHPDITNHVNKQLEDMGYDGLIIKKESLDSEKGYNEIGGTYGSPQIVVFDRKNVTKAENNSEKDLPLQHDAETTGSDKIVPGEKQTPDGAGSEIGSGNDEAAILNGGGESKSGKIEGREAQEQAIEDYAKEKITARINIAPLFKTSVNGIAQARELSRQEFYKKYRQKVEEIAGYFNVRIVNAQDGLGAFEGDLEVTTYLEVEAASFNDVVDFAAVMGALTPEVQESTIAGTYVKDGHPNHNANKIEIGIDNEEAAIRALKQTGFDKSGYTLTDGILHLFDFSKGASFDFRDKLISFESLYKDYGGQIQTEETFAAQSEYIDHERRSELMGKIKSEGLQQQQGRPGFRDAIIDAEKRNEAYGRWRRIALDESGKDTPEVKELKTLRGKQIEGQPLTEIELSRLRELEKYLSDAIIPVVESDKSRYEEAKAEIESIARDVISNIEGGFNAEFGIKRPSRAAEKIVRWYDVQPNKLGDGARTNIIVSNNAQADFVFNYIKAQYATTLDRSEFNRESLGYPKRLVEIRSSNGKIAEIQVMTPEGYLAKDGVKHFPKDKQAEAEKHLSGVRKRLGWRIPDGVGHYFYEIHRDPNVPLSLRNKAYKISRKYYDAFLDPNSVLSENEFRKEVYEFKDIVDTADKSKWDKSNKGRSPKELDAFLMGDSDGEKPLTDKDFEKREGETRIQRDARLSQSLKDRDYKQNEIDHILKKGVAGIERVEQVREETAVVANLNKILAQLQKTPKKMSLEAMVQTAIDRVQHEWVKSGNETILENAIRKFKQEHGIKVDTPVDRAVKPKPVKITVDEKKALIDQIKAEMRSSKETSKFITDGFKSVAKHIHDILKQHKTTISTRQFDAIQKRMAMLKIGSNESIRKYVDYVEKVLADAEYADQLSDVKKTNRRLKKALSNDKIPGSVRATANDFIKLDPADVQDLNKHQQYANELYEAMKSGGVQVKEGIVVDKTRKAADLSKIDNYIEKEMKLANERAEESMNEEYATTAEAEDNTDEIKDYIQRKFDRLKSWVGDVLRTGTNIDGSTADFTPEEVSLIKKVMGMKLDQLSNVKDWYEATEALDHFLANGDLGLIPHIVNKYQNAVTVNKGTETLIDKTKGNISMLPITKFFADMEATIFKTLGIKRNPKDSYNTKTFFDNSSLRRWDNLLKNFKDYGIYENTFYHLAKAQANYKTKVRQMDAHRIQKDLLKSNGYDQKKTLESKFKITAFLRQLEYESNSESKTNKPAIDYLNATVKAAENLEHPIQGNALDMLKSMIAKYSVDGQISLEALEKSFTPGEKKAIADIRQLYKELAPYHDKVSLAIRNKPFTAIDNYSHISAYGVKNKGLSASESKKNEYLSVLQGTKSGTIEERSGATSPINMDPFSTANTAVRDVMLDYWMTNPFRNVEKILDNFKKYSVEEVQKYPRGSREYENAMKRKNIADAWGDIYEDLRENMLGRSYFESNPLRDLTQLMGKRAVQFTLGKPDRLLAELLSNTGFAINSASKEFALGTTKYNKYNHGEIGAKIMENVQSSATERLHPHGGIATSVMDTQDFDISVSDNQNAVSETKRRAMQLYYNTIARGVRLGQLANEGMITSGDLLIARPIWTGTMATEFKKITGKEIDFDKISANDIEYMDANEDAIDKARTVADRKVTDAAATKNPFETAPKMSNRSTQLLQAINTYMRGFNMNEYELASDALMALYKGGKVSREEAVAILEGITTRAGMYKAVQAKAAAMIMTGMMLAGAYFNGDDEMDSEIDKLLATEGPDTPEQRRKTAEKLLEFFTTANPKIPGLDKEVGNALKTTDKEAVKSWKSAAQEPNSFAEDFTKGIAQQGLSMLTQRNFGNIVQGFVTAPVFEELINKKMRDEYDPYRDSYLYSKVPDTDKKNWVQKTVEANLGAYGLPMATLMELGTAIIDKRRDEKKLAEVNKKLESHTKPDPINDPDLKDYYKLIEEKAKLEKKVDAGWKRIFKEALIMSAMTSGAIPALKNVDKAMDKMMQDAYRKPKDFQKIQDKIDAMKHGIKPETIEKAETSEVRPSEIYEWYIKNGKKIPATYEEAVKGVLNGQSSSR